MADTGEPDDDGTRGFAFRGRTVRCVRTYWGGRLEGVWTACEPRRDPAATRDAAWAHRTRATRRYVSGIARFLRRLLVHAAVRTRGIGARLAFADLVALWERQRGRCALTGVRMSHTHSLAVSDRFDRNVSLDRVDSRGPYAPGNLQLVCCAVNRMKSQAPDDAFVWWCRAVADRGASISVADRERIARARRAELDPAAFV